MPDSHNEDRNSAQSLGEFMIARGMLDRAGLQRALRLQSDSGGEIDTILTTIGIVSEADIATALVDFLNIPLMDAEDYPVTPVLDDQFSTNFLKAMRVIPISDTAEGLIVAMANPLNDYAVEALRLATGKPVLPRVGVVAHIEAAFERLYGQGRTQLEEIMEETVDEDEASDSTDIERLKGLASEAPVIRLVNFLIARAVESRASDIHIEPFEHALRVRYRIDGVLQNVEAPPSHLRSAVVSRIKIMANLNIAERRLPQDGRIRMVTRGKEIDLRISTVPAMDGESVVIRILDRGSISLGFPALGFEEDMLAKFLPVLERPNGIVLVTGPTGSGKTTTLYACLQRLNSDEKKLLSVEDPVEYRLTGINQVQVRSRIGLDFAQTLRAFLRQDPDIIMIGEIRDFETAQIAVQAALTGHLVLSTLHTNDAASSVTRLLDMGVQEYLLTSTLNGILAQRLVRTLCADCREPFVALPEMVDRMQLQRLSDDDQITLFRPIGCNKCSGTGYLGRSAITEFLVMTEPLHQIVLRKGEANEIYRAAVKEGMTSMYEDGLRKAIAGVTTVEEVLRVTRET